MSLVKNVLTDLLSWFYSNDVSYLVVFILKQNTPTMMKPMFPSPYYIKFQQGVLAGTEAKDHLKTTLYTKDSRNRGKFACHVKDHFILLG